MFLPAAVSRVHIWDSSAMGCCFCLEAVCSRNTAHANESASDVRVRLPLAGRDKEIIRIHVLLFDS